ncbi:PLP-dependent aminotransferase family protein [Xylocopilactobacillus apicola]|uniref:Aminotransferase n=1 Tax=Xylocopilactobacillus apicola TaxID=2932184 RepID=A0AAU9CY87_9LACO|nr:PLP-dependent aminotransferase family protein [Xylocopilactobacillus apicola]BDR58987.1 aminotransferase [Xylocopilactobacillus apicola]
MNFSSRTDLTINSGLNDIFKTRDSQTISFAGGLPDNSLFPQKELAQAFHEVITNDDPSVFQYSAEQLLPLRDKITQKMKRYGVNAKSEDILFTQGAQQALSLAAQLLIDKGDGIVVEAPTYVGALAAFDAVEPSFYEVPVDNDGMNIDALEHILKHHEVKMIYTIPDFQNPTGVVMSTAKRKAIVELANRYDVVIVEDEAYRDLRYTGTQLPTIKQFDTQGRVIYIGSFSKILAPAMRLGWLVATPKMRADLAALKGSTDIETSSLTMHAVNDYLAANDIDQHIDEVRNIYCQKKDLMYQALAENLPEEVEFNNPEGGFFIWLKLPNNFDTEEFLDQYLLPEANVTFVPSKNLFTSKNVLNGARLNFTQPTDEQICEGCLRLGQALKNYRLPIAN